MEHAAPLEPPMNSLVVRHAKDLDGSARAWLQGLFGRPLRDDEDVTIVVSAAHATPPEPERRAAFQRLERILDRAAENMREVSDDEFDDAANEAMKNVRPTFEP
jgi:hypothetical protein